MRTIRKCLAPIPESIRKLHLCRAIRVRIPRFLPPASFRVGLGLLLATALLSGCSRGFFAAHGYIASDGGPFGRWHARPQGCSRAPIDGRPTPESASVASFFWEDPADHDITLRDQNVAKAPDAPLRLDILHKNGATFGRFQTVKKAGSRLDATVCTAFQVETTEEPATYANGRPTLRGAVEFDCHLRGSHLTGHFDFRRCEF